MIKHWRQCFCLFFFKKSMFIGSHIRTVPPQNTSKSKQNVSNDLEKNSCEMLQRRQIWGKIQPKFYHAAWLCKPPSVHSSDLLVQTQKRRRQQLLADGMEGEWAQVYRLPDQNTESSVTRTDAVSTWPIRSSWLLFRISTASTFWLWRLLLLHRGPKQILKKGLSHHHLWDV